MDQTEDAQPRQQENQRTRRSSHGTKKKKQNNQKSRAAGKKAKIITRDVQQRGAWFSAESGVITGKQVNELDGFWGEGWADGGRESEDELVGSVVGGVSGVVSGMESKGKKKRKSGGIINTIMSDIGMEEAESVA